MGQVPAFVIDGVTITQSMAILEFLEEKFADRTNILPIQPMDRAKVSVYVVFTLVRFISATVITVKFFGKCVCIRTVRLELR